jgi:hypothetical protein
MAEEDESKKEKGKSEDDFLLLPFSFFLFPPLTR